MHVKCRYVESAQCILVVIIIINTGRHGCMVTCLSSLSSIMLCSVNLGLTLQTIFYRAYLHSSGVLIRFCQQGGWLQRRRGGLASSFASFQCYSGTNWAALLPPRSESPPLEDPFPETLASDNPNLTHLFSQARGGSFLAVCSVLLTVSLLAGVTSTPVKPMPYVQYSL